MEPELIVKFKGDLTEWNAAIAKAKSDMASLDSFMRKAAQASAVSAKATASSTTANTQLIAALNSLGRKINENSANLKSYSSGITENTNALKSNTTELNKVSDNLSKFSKNTDNAGMSIGGFVKGYLSLATAMEAGRIFLDSTKQAQKFENQLKVASETQADYAKNTQFLEGLATKYNKNVIDLGANFAQLSIATKDTNLEGEKTERLFAAVTASSAALQMSVDDTNGTFRAFIQMVSKGNVQAEELRGQLGERLYGAFNLAAKAMGVNTAELNKMLENGEVLASDLLPKITVELENAFGAQAEMNAKNLGSAIEYTTGQLTLFLAEFAKGTGFTDWISDQAKGVGELSKQLRILGKQGSQAVIGGALGGGLESLLDEKSIYKYINKDGYKSPALEYARNIQKLGINTTDGDYINTFPGQYKPKGYSLPGSLLDKQTEDSKVVVDPAQLEKKRKEAEAAARKADAAVNKWVSEQIRESNDRIAQGLIEAKQAQEQHYQGRPAAGIGERASIGTGIKVTDDLSKSYKVFTNEVTGDGIATTTKHIEDQILAIGKNSKAWGIEAMAKSKAAKAAIDLNAATVDLNKSITAIADQAKIEFFVGLGESIGQLLVDGSSIENVGDRIAMIMGEMISQIGKAIVAYAFTMDGLKTVMSNVGITNPGVALAVGVAAVAAGSALKAAASKRASEGAKKMWTGGVVDGPGGLDKIPTMLTRGEMVLNKKQQSNLLGIANGVHSGNSLGGGNSAASRGSGTMRVIVEGQLRNDRLEIANRRGSRSNRYFE